MKHSDRKATRIELARDARALIALGMKPDEAAAAIGATRTLMFKGLRELREVEAALNHTSPLASAHHPLLD